MRCSPIPAMRQWSDSIVSNYASDEKARRRPEESPIPAADRRSARRLLGGPNCKSARSTINRCRLPSRNFRRPSMTQTRATEEVGSAMSATLSRDRFYRNTSPSMPSNFTVDEMGRPVRPAINHRAVR